MQQACAFLLGQTSVLARPCACAHLVVDVGDVISVDAVGLVSLKRLLEDGLREERL